MPEQLEDIAKNQTIAPKVLDFPRYFQVETTSVCNARCTMCLTRFCKRHSPNMSDALFEKVADELKGHAGDVDRVIVQLAGEPLLDRKLEDRIRVLKNSGIRYVAFASNGSLMSEDRCESVLASGVDEVSFSVDGATKQTYESIRVGLNFEQVMQNIESFIRLRDATKSHAVIRLRMTVQQANRDELARFVDYWNEHLGPQDDVYAKVIHTWGNSDKLDELPEGYDYQRLNSTACSSPWSSMVIFCDGRVPLCCCDYEARICLGNVANESIEEVWHSRALKRVRDLHRKSGRDSIDMCTNCTVGDDEAKSHGDR